MKLRIFTFTKSLISKFRFRTTQTTNLKTGKTTYSVSPRTGIKRFRRPRTTVSRRFRVGKNTTCTVTSGGRRGTRITNTHTLVRGTRRAGGVGRVRVSYSYKTSAPGIRKPRVRKSTTRISTPRIKKSYSYRAPRVRVRSSVRAGVRRSYTPRTRIRSTRIRTGSYRIRRRY